MILTLGRPNPVTRPVRHVIETVGKEPRAYCYRWPLPRGVARPRLVSSDDLAILESALQVSSDYTLLSPQSVGKSFCANDRAVSLHPLRSGML